MWRKETIKLKIMWRKTIKVMIMWRKVILTNKKNRLFDYIVICKCIMNM